MKVNWREKKHDKLIKMCWVFSEKLGMSVVHKIFSMVRVEFSCFPKWEIKNKHMVALRLFFCLNVYQFSTENCKHGIQK